MCGIAGIVDFSGKPVDPGALAIACDTMRHRGPDDAGTWIDATPPVCVGLAATRLAILDTSPAGHQPMLRDDGRHVVVFNGLIYNHGELHDELTRDGLMLTTRCDTEIVLAACARWGTDALPRFNGMWALAFYDRRTQSGFLSRDRFGVKPLVWTCFKQRLSFASEIRTLRRIGDWPRDVNNAALSHYVRFGFVAHPDTIYEQAHRLPPGTWMPFDARGVGEPARHYRLPVGPATGDHIDPGEAAIRVRRALFQSVARRRVADVPIGAFLSGGLDSSIIVHHLSELTPGRVRTFCVGWDEHGVYDESRFARLAAGQFGTEHYELRCKYRDVIDLLPTMLDHLGEPFFDSSILPTAIVSQFARRHVTVCLSGDGGDELFGGYWRYIAHRVYERYRRLPGLLRSGIIEPITRRASASKSSMLGDRVRQFRKLLRGASDDPLRRHVAWSRILAPGAASILRCDDDDNSIFNRLLRDTDGMASADPMNRILAFDLQYGLPNDMLHKVDLASMFHSLEVRTPFLDPEVVAVAMSLPSSMKLHGGDGKVILKDAYCDVLPDEILTRRKMGFEVPIGEFLRRELRDMFNDTVTRDVIASFELLDYDAIRSVYDDHCAKRGEHADLLFALLSLCWWRRSGG